VLKERIHDFVPDTRRLLKPIEALLKAAYQLLIVNIPVRLVHVDLFIKVAIQEGGLYIYLMYM